MSKNKADYNRVLEEYFENGEFDQTMCDVYFFEVTEKELDMVREREDWILKQRGKS